MDIQKERRIPFSNEWFGGQHRIEQAGHYPFAICGLLCYMENSHLATEITIDSILRVFNMQEKNQRNTLKIKDALNYLKEQDLIVFYDGVLMKNVIEMDLEQIKGKTPMYIRIKEKLDSKVTLIKFSEFRALLLDEEHKGNAKVELICYFSTIVYHINTQTKRAFPSLALLNSEACVGRVETCSEYNDFLMDNLKLIRFQSSGKTNPETGNPYPTQYVRYEDLEALEEEMKRQIGYSVGSKVSRMKKKNMSARAGLSRRIRNLNNQLSNFNEDDICNRTSEYIAIKDEIKALEKERSALQIEYDNLKQKGHH